MSVRYDGKSPGKLWYFWQKTKAMAQTPFHYETQGEAKKIGKNMGIFVGAAAATQIVLGVGIIAALPLLPTLISLAGFSTALYFGWNGVRQIGPLAKSSFVYGSVREAEDKWLERKQKGNVLQRTLKNVKDGVAKLADKIPLPLAKAGKWLGFGAAGAGVVAAVGAGLHYLGVPGLAAGSAVATSVATAGAAIGLTAAATVAVVAGLAVAAIPLGILAAASLKASVNRRAPAERPTFGKPKGPKPPSNDDGDRNTVFQPKATSVNFNDNAPPAKDDGLTEQRRKAAEARANNKSRRPGGPKFQ
ncbi:MAG: hypothetical protein ACAH80_04065 [Alphaproteobacteria bacterium]